jgi:hypothetical protein
MSILAYYAYCEVGVAAVECGPQNRLRLMNARLSTIHGPAK